MSTNLTITNQFVNPKMLSFLMGVGIFAYSLTKYTPEFELIPMVGILIGAYFVLLALQNG